jgi:hypothetical protein
MGDKPLCIFVLSAGLLGLWLSIAKHWEQGLSRQLNLFLNFWAACAPQKYQSQTILMIVLWHFWANLGLQVPAM